MFEIGEEGGEALAAFVGEAAVAFLNVVVAVPRLERTVPDLDVAHAALYEAAGNEHLFRLRGVAVERANGGGFAVDVEGVGRSGLHPKRCLETLDARLEGGVGAGGLVAAVERRGEVELRALGGGIEVGVGEMVDEVGGFAVLRFDVSALVGAREEGGLPVVGTGDGHALGDEDDEAGEVVVFGAEAVGDPRADAGAGHNAGAAIHEAQTVFVDRRIRIHRADHAEIVSVFGRERTEEFADLKAGLAVARETKRRAEGGAGGTLGGEMDGEALAVEF